MVFLWFSHKTTIFPWFSYDFPIKPPFSHGFPYGKPFQAPDVTEPRPDPEPQPGAVPSPQRGVLGPVGAAVAAAACVGFVKRGSGFTTGERPWDWYKMCIYMGL